MIRFAVFCKKQKGEDDRESLILARGDQSFVLMNLFPYNNAHLMIAPYKHVGTTNDLEKRSLNEIMWFADRSMTIMKKILMLKDSILALISV